MMLVWCIWFVGGCCFDVCDVVCLMVFKVLTYGLFEYVVLVFLVLVYVFNLLFFLSLLF